MTKPLKLHSGEVIEAWIDEFGHMNMAYYLLACDSATFAFWNHANGDVPLEAREGAEYAVVEAHINYVGEVRLGDRFDVETQVISADAKRFRLFHTMRNAADGSVAATNEVMALGFSLESRGIMEFRPEVRDRLQALAEAHRDLPAPDNAGRAIGQPRRK